MSRLFDATCLAASLRSPRWRVPLLVAITVAAAGCATPSNQQWKRPGSSPISLELDKATCKTQSLLTGAPSQYQLEVEVGLCLRQLGWYPVK